MELLNPTRSLCHGISFSRNAPEPLLRLRRGQQWIDEPLAAGRNLEFSVDEGKFCLGYTTMNEDGTRTMHPCDGARGLRTGTQCERCRRADQTRFMRQFHKTGQAPAGLRKYLEQPHFLYVASFAHGATKVGTTSTQSKYSRLVQQGAVSARYIARATDGAAIRVLEDLVTEHVGLKQQVRQKSKIKGLASWEYSCEELDELNASEARAAAGFLARQKGLDTYGIQLLDEQFEQPSFARPVLQAWDSQRLHSWPRPVAGSRFTVRIAGVLGQAILVDSGPDSPLRLIDAAELKTRNVTLRTTGAPVPEANATLF